MACRTKQSVFACVVLALISSSSTEPIPNVPSITVNSNILGKRLTSTTATGDDAAADGNAWDPLTDDVSFQWDDLTDPYGEYDMFTLNITGDYLANNNESNDGDFGFDNSTIPEPEEIEYSSNITTVSYDDVVAQSGFVKQEPDFTVAGTLVWLENWIKNNMSQVDYDNTEFISAFLDSIRPIWPGADPARRLNFRCTIDSPCNAGITPPSLDTDVRYAWRVMIAMQNMNTFWSLQVDLWQSVSVWFAAQFDAIWNRLSRDGSTMSYPGLLPSWVSAGKNFIKVLGTLNEALKSQIEFVAPYLGLVIDMIRLINPTPELPPLIPNADIQARFADYIAGHARTTRRSFDRIMSGDPFDPTSGFYTIEARDQELVAELWSQCLSIDHAVIQVDSNFFSLGGSSISSLQLTAKAKNLGLDWNIKFIFANPELSQQSAAVSGLKPEAALLHHQLHDIAPFALLPTRLKRTSLLRTFQSTYGL